MPGALDALKSMGKEAGGSITGMLEKAVIIIEDRRGLETGEPDIAPPGGRLGKKSRGTEDITNSLRENNSFIYRRNLRGREAQQVLNQEMRKIQEDEVKLRALRVQFNPNSLRLAGHGGGRVSQMDYSKGGQGKIIVGSVNGRIDFHVNLIFDCVNIQDSFMNEKLTANPTSVAKGVGIGLYNAAKGREYEVQTEVEGFIAALNGNATRKMEFVWGHLLYRGRLNSVEAAYTMFNPNGQPVRASIHLSMACTERNNRSELEMWDSRYRATFTQQGPGGETRGKNMSANMAFQKQLQNILNL